jgi:hypothetical protein
MTVLYNHDHSAKETLGGPSGKSTTDSLRREIMDDKIIAELLSTMQDIRDRLGGGGSTQGYFPGIVADPGPDWPGGPWGPWGPRRPQTPIGPGILRGPVDPAPWHLLDKFRIAKLKVSHLEMEMEELNRQAEFIQVQIGLLKEEYNI